MHHQGGSKITAIGGPALLFCRSNMADFATKFEAEAVGFAPPVALIVIDTACIQANISADSGYFTMARCGNTQASLLDSGVLFGNGRIFSQFA